MKRLLCCLIALGAVSLPTALRADEGDEKKTKAESKSEKQVIRVYRTVTVGDDGKIKVESDGDDIADLPDRVKKQLEKAGIKLLVDPQSGDKGLKIHQILRSKLAKTDSDGDEAGDEGVKVVDVVSDFMGEMIIVDRDGKKTIAEFAPKSGDIKKAINLAIDTDSLGDGQAKAALAEAMKALDKDLAKINEQVQIRVRLLETDQDEEEETVEQSAKPDVQSKVLDKLDQILNRLDKLEAEVDKLKSDRIEV